MITFKSNAMAKAKANNVYNLRQYILFICKFKDWNRAFGVNSHLPTKCCVMLIFLRIKPLKIDGNKMQTVNMNDERQQQKQRIRN